MPDQKEMKDAVKEAVNEWLDEKFQEFGKWSMRGIAAGALGALVYFILVSEGWHK